MQKKTISRYFYAAGAVHKCTQTYYYYALARKDEATLFCYLLPYLSDIDKTSNLGQTCFDVMISSNSTRLLMLFFEDFRTVEVLGIPRHTAELISQQKPLLY